jgi:hypothetical protein
MLQRIHLNKARQNERRGALAAQPLGATRHFWRGNTYKNTQPFGWVGFFLRGLKNLINVWVSVYDVAFLAFVLVAQ